MTHMPRLPVVLLLILLAATARGAEVNAPNVRVTYDGIDESQAQAIADTLSAARKVYVEHFGFEMPGRIICTVDCGADKTSRLFTDGNDRVFLSMPSADKLARPSRSGTFTLYGLCHELGHVAMYRIVKDHGWMTTAAAEGWAHYAGSQVVDEVYKSAGEALWTPDPYDYRADGTARLDRQLKERSPGDVARGAGKWAALGKVVGPAGFRKVFESWQAADAHPTDAGAADGAILKGLAEASPEKKQALAQWWADARPVLLEEPAASLFKKAGLDRSRLQGRPVKLEPDDGTAESKKSLAGGGHARRFKVPGGAGGDWYLTAVSIHGARYGADRPPAVSFDVSLCDADMLPVATWKQPYKLFTRGEAKWVRIEPPPTRVPAGDGGFYVVLNFRPTATQGVFVSVDDSTNGRDKRSSLVARPGDEGSPLAGGDWMIRVELDRPAASDALK
jgi:hypothetical protein